ncbi:uncharacterized protein LOC132312333 isoform X2 [Cornus florida]|uniref:uncharacterized protein LOC132312333 isoform X2 n=1 Tax=Cornus florida TaxID=4283 RepID=UPI0028963437|nr:uncharacterized protein LOC132312333 isoform X2 [Cornus florida]
MAADVVLKDESVSLCCAVWKEKCSKLNEQRKALRQAVSIYEQQLEKSEAENRNLKKATEEERLLAEILRDEKAKESAIRVSLENEISALKSEILSLQQKAGPQGQDMERERMLLQTRVSEGETEINQLKEVLAKERMRADSERKKAEAAKKKANEAQKSVKEEKNRADEEKRLANIEREKAEETRLRLETLNGEADEMRSKLVLETRKSEEARKKLEVERQKTIKEKKRADLEMTKAEEQRKLAEMNRKREMDEKCRADKFSQQLEEHKREIEKLQKEIYELVSSRKLVEAAACLPDKQTIVDTEKASKMLGKEKQMATREKKHAGSEISNTEKQKKIAEVNRKKAMEEKHRADLLALQLEVNERRIKELQKEIFEFQSSKTLVEAPVEPPDRIVNAETAKRKLLKKQLRFEKMRVEHAKQVMKLEMGRNNILRQELRCLKQELIQFSLRLEILDKSFLPGDEGIDDLAKIGCLSNTQSLNLKKKSFAVEPCQMKHCVENEIVKSSCRKVDASVKQTVECAAPLLPISGGTCSQSISGIDSKLEPLLRGSNRKILQSSAINSSMASFSDRPLMGSQERGSFSLTASANFSEEKSSLQPSISSISGEVTELRYNGNLAMVAENSVGSPINVDSAGRKVGHGKKRKIILDAVESVEHMYSEPKKLHLQKEEEKCSVLKGMLNSQMDRALEEERFMVANLQGNLYAKDISYKKRKASPGKEVTIHYVHESDGQKDGTEDGNICVESSPCSNKLTGGAQTCMDGILDNAENNQEIWGNFENVANGDYMKLLDLDSAVDEECYRVATEIPLSPTLPEIEFKSNEAFVVDDSMWLVDGSSYGEFSSEKDNLVPSCGFDVINVEIDSNKFKSNGTFGTSPLLHGSDGFDNSFESLENSDNCKHNITYVGDASVCQIWDSDIKDSCSISRIFCATRTCMAQCSIASQSAQVVQKILSALLEIKDLLPREKVCVFFSLLLNNFSGIALGNLGNFLKSDSVLFLDSFAEEISAVMSDVEKRSMFAELCHLDDLLTLIEDFLIDQRVLVYSDVDSDLSVVCNSKVVIILDGTDIVLSSETASTHQLVAGGIVLASICAAVDHIGFICESSYNISRMQKFDSSLMLTILHVFAHICGSKYFSLDNYSLLMTVLKSLVMFFERATLSSDSACGLPSLTEVRAGFPSCTECPFSEGAVSMDTVVSLLLEKLQNFTFSGAMHQDLMKSVNSSKSETVSIEEKAGQNSGHEDVHSDLYMNCNLCWCLNKSGMLTTQSNSVFGETLCHLSDILSLVELVACKMSWDWTCNNIVSPLLKKLESCIPENYLAAILILLGHLGRLGVDANGYDDIGVGNLRSWLSSFLCQNSTRNFGLSIRIAAITALLGLLPVNFEELIKSNIEFPAIVSKSLPVDCIREWFSLLSNEQQSLLFGLLQSAGMTNCGTG